LEYERRFLKAFAEDHLAIDASVNFMIYILETRARAEVGRNRVGDVASVDLDLRWLSQHGTQTRKREEDGD